MSEADTPTEEGAAPAEGAPDAAATVVAAPSGPERYDVASKERVVAQRMPTLDIVNERFARHLQSGLFALMRRHADVVANGVAVKRHSAFMGGCTAGSHYNLLALEPLRGQGLLVCASEFLYGLVEALYGGVGRPRAADALAREISATEQRVLARFVKMVCAEYARAWNGIHPVAPSFVRSESLPQFAAVCGAAEIVVVSSFDVTLGELTGRVDLCMPYAALEPLRDLLYASPLGDVSKVDQRWASRLKRELQAAEVTLGARLATAEVTVGQLLSMKPGDFIELEREPRLEAAVDGVPLFKCHYGTNNGKYAIRIDECLPTSGEHHGE